MIGVPSYTYAKDASVTNLWEYYVLLLFYFNFTIQTYI